MSPNPERWTCPKCGVTIHVRKCRGHSKRTGLHCGDWAEQGSTVCRRHGARAPQTIAAAERRLVEERARRAVATYGLPRSVDPHDALLEELHRTAGHVGWLSELVADLEHEASGRARVGSDDDGRVSSGVSGLKQYTRDKGLTWEKPSVWVELYHTERAHLARVAKACIDAGVAERRVELAEQQGRLLADVVRQIVTGLGHDLADERVRAVVTPALQLVRGTAA